MPNGIPIHIGNFSYTIHFYGIIIMLGVVAGAFLSRGEAKRRGLDRAEVVGQEILEPAAVIHRYHHPCEGIVFESRAIAAHFVSPAAARPAY